MRFILNLLAEIVAKSGNLSFPVFPFIQVRYLDCCLFVSINLAATVARIVFLATVRLAGSRNLIYFGCAMLVDFNLSLISAYVTVGIVIVRILVVFHSIFNYFITSLVSANIPVAILVVFNLAAGSSVGVGLVFIFIT